MKKYIVLLAIPFWLVSCGEPNHYDSHVDEEAETVTDDRHDIIQGRARHPDSIGVTDTTNIGIGDTTLIQTPH